MQMLCRPTLEVELFLAKISEQNLRDLRKLSIRAEVRSDSPWREGERKGLCAVSCEIDIQQTGVKVKINGRASQGLVERRQVEANNLKLKIIDAATSGPSLGLGSKDFYDIRVGIAALVQ